MKQLFIFHLSYPQSLVATQTFAVDADFLIHLLLQYGMRGFVYFV
jgi:hypothetical protein